MSVSGRRATTTRQRRGETIALRVPPRCGLRVSERAFWRLCQANRDLRLERTARGELIVMAPAGSETGRRNASLTAQLWAWNQASGLGMSFDSSAGFRLPNGLTRSPDASWIARGRWEAIPPEERLKFAPLCPDFVVELRSPSDEKPRLRDRMQDYIDQGARLGWLIDPVEVSVDVYRAGRPVETLARPTTLSGDEVLPGFVLDLKGILFD